MSSYGEKEVSQESRGGSSLLSHPLSSTSSKNLKGEEPKILNTRTVVLCYAISLISNASQKGCRHLALRQPDSRTQFPPRTYVTQSGRGQHSQTVCCPCCPCSERLISTCCSVAVQLLSSSQIEWDDSFNLVSLIMGSLYLFSQSTRLISLYVVPAGRYERSIPVVKRDDKGKEKKVILKV